MPALSDLTTVYAYNVPLVLLSALVAGVTALVLLLLQERLRSAVGIARWFWRAIATLAGGTGIWTVFFTGLLSLRLPVPHTISMPGQLLVLGAILVSSALLVLTSGLWPQHPGRKAAVRGAGLAVAALGIHALSLASLRMDGTLQYRSAPLALWAGALVILTPLVLSWLSRVVPGDRYWRRKALLLTPAVALYIVAVQHGTTALTVFTPSPSAAGPPVGLDPVVAGIPAAAGALAILTLTAIMAYSERRVLTFLKVMTDRQPDAVLTVDRQSQVVYANPAAAELAGRPADDLIGRPLREALPAPMARALQEPLGGVLRGNVPRSLELSLAPDRRWYEVRLVPWPDVISVVLRDITERKELEAQIRFQAEHDALTGLPNRTRFRQRVAEALAGGRPPEIAVLFLDLDDFKMVNDTYGHTAGDRLLESIADRLRAALDPAEIVSRLGGDEFAIMLRTGDPERAEETAQRILDVVRAPIDLGAAQVAVTTSIGIVTTRDEEVSADALLSYADMAMFSAKAGGKGQARHYHPALYKAALDRMEGRQALARAIERGELTLHYQPIVTLDGGEVSCLEALVRWEHPERGLILPQEFIPLAEETGLIIPLGEWVLRTACVQVRRWQDQFGAAITLSVNLSGRQLEWLGFHRQVAAALEQSGLDPRQLVLEVTENSLLRNTPTVRSELAALKTLGIRLAVDDFGTGYSSLVYLRQIAFDLLKIDRSFVQAVGKPGRDGRLLRAITNLAREMDLTVIAEGIETTEQAAALRQLACDFGQGLLYARPLPAPAMTEFLAGRPRRRFLQQIQSVSGPDPE